MGNFEDLICFYDRLSNHVKKFSEKNPCGECSECCGYLFYISGYEFDYINAFLRENRSKISISFVRLLPGEVDPRMKTQIWPCPLLDNKCCLAYEARPLPCRLMGPYVPYTSEIIEKCVYKKPIIYNSLDDIPLWHDFTHILKKHPSPPGYFILTPSQSAQNGPV